MHGMLFVDLTLLQAKWRVFAQFSPELGLHYYSIISDCMIHILDVKYVCHFELELLSR